MRTGSEHLEKLSRIERALSVGMEQVEAQLETRQAVLSVLREGLRAYKGLREPRASRRKFREQFSEVIRSDKELGFPHRKILDCLLGKYDPAKDDFTEIHFSRLVREARIGKNMAKSYLDLLLRKGYIEIRDDGYRKFYRIKTLSGGGHVQKVFIAGDYSIQKQKG